MEINLRGSRVLEISQDCSGPTSASVNLRDSQLSVIVIVVVIDDSSMVSGIRVCVAEAPELSLVHAAQYVVLYWG